jgi:hypothetical protein
LRFDSLRNVILSGAGSFASEGSCFAQDDSSKERIEEAMQSEA